MNGETRHKVTWVGMMKTGLQEEILKDKYLVFCIHTKWSITWGKEIFGEFHRH